MGLVANGYRLGHSPFKHIGGALVSIYGAARARRNQGLPGDMRGIARLTSATSALPEGNLAPAAWMLPQKGGAMSMRALGQGAFAAGLVPTRPMTIDLTGSGGLTAIGALVVSMALAMAGSGSLTASIQGRLNATLDMTGSGGLTAAMTGLGNMVLDALGQGDLDATIAAFGDMEIDLVVTGTGLSTANVGAAVWQALAASFNSPGTMGEKLNDAGSAANPWTEDLSGPQTAGTAGHMLKIVQQILRNKQITDPDTGVMTVYDDDGTTVLFTANLKEDAAGTQAYRGQGADRRERLA